ncbi:hypothetical protein JCM12298_30490 [Desulfothermus naphthae]
MLLSDNGSQPTSRSFMQYTKQLNIKQILQHIIILKEMQILKRVIKTIREEVIWINEFTSLTEASETISKWIEKKL